MILLSSDLVETSKTQIPVSFVKSDGGDVFVSHDIIKSDRKAEIVAGLISINFDPRSSTGQLPDGIDVLVVVQREDPDKSREEPLFTGWIRKATGTESRPVKTVQFQKEVFSRIDGLYETDALKAKKVLIIGLGSGGSSIAIELAKAGIANFVLVDHDRLEVINIVRHVCGISDLGRFKTKAVKDEIHEKNPAASVETIQEEVTWEWLPKLQQLVKSVDVVFCCTDNRASRILVNLASLGEGRTCIYGGTFNRAYGGHVLRVIPKQTMCYQCFVDILPEKAEDTEIASQDHANRVAYDDRVVPVEPGLANDIAPIATMCVKLGILELLRGQSTTLASLYSDLSNAWYQWLNRREAGTEYADLKPLDSGEDDGFRILAWYGISNDADPACPACGDLVGIKLGTHAAKTYKDRFDAFGNSGDQLREGKLFPPSDPV